MTDNILEIANELTSKDRIGSYGHPLDDYTCTSAIWTAMLRNAGLLKDDAEISAELAITMMMGMKVSRLSQNLTHLDSIQDAAGYARCLQLVLEERHNREQDEKPFILRDDHPIHSNVNIPVMTSTSVGPCPPPPEPKDRV